MLSIEEEEYQQLAFLDTVVSHVSERGRQSEASMSSDQYAHALARALCHEACLHVFDSNRKFKTRARATRDGPTGMVKVCLARQTSRPIARESS